MELSKIKVKNTIYCECGHAYTINERIGELVKNTDYHFYGGRAEFFADVKCPKCGKEFIAIIDSTNNGYRVFDIAEKISEKIEEKETEKEIFIEGYTCDYCKKTFKSKSGLIAHRKKCYNS